MDKKTNKINQSSTTLFSLDIIEHKEHHDHHEPHSHDDDHCCGSCQNQGTCTNQKSKENSIQINDQIKTDQL